MDEKDLLNLKLAKEFSGRSVKKIHAYYELTVPKMLADYCKEYALHCCPEGLPVETREY